MLASLILRMWVEINNLVKFEPWNAQMLPLLHPSIVVHQLFDTLSLGLFEYRWSLPDAQWSAQGWQVVGFLFAIINY